MKQKSLPTIFKIVGIWLAVLWSLYFFLEATFFYYFTWIFPLSAYSHAGMGAGIALQYSKKSTYPHDYIALLGDSYAFGQGDWLLEGEHSIRPAYSPAHILHQTLKKDVLTFGFPASDSIRANNVLPKLFLDSAEKSGLKKIEDPSIVIVYFYEGNDLNDNVEVVDRLIYPLLKNKKELYDEVNFQNVTIPALIDSNELMLQIKNIAWSDSLFFYSFSKNILIEAYQNYRSGKAMAPWKPPKKGITTQIKVRGITDYLQDHIQSPALSLDADQIHLGLYVFEQSLIALQKRFPGTRIGIAYIPSVITSYDVISPNINDYYKDPRRSPERIQSSSQIRKNSDAICQQVRSIALQRGMGFVDPRGRLRAVAKDRYIHGPIDWNHFNRLGYETLSEELILLVQQLAGPSKMDLPACRWEM